MPDSECALGRIDPLQLAWAAGFFDGEGSTIVHECRPGYLRLTVSVPQSGGADPPEVLKRFQQAMLGLGEIDPLNSEGMWAWRSRSAEEGQAAIALMWSQLGTVKRAQAGSAVRRFRAQYAEGRLKPRMPRRRRQPHALHASRDDDAHLSHDLQRAWVAGFLDGEGCFGLVRAAGARKHGPDWYRIRASVTQRSDIPGPPEVLFRLRDVVGFGRIERHGDPHAYKWVAERGDRVDAIVRLTGPWLGEVKATQARMALERFRSQVRLKGNTTRCKRGHEYTRQVVKRDGRLRKICNPCDRILDRQTRAAQGIPPRQFKNVARRYTF